MPSDSLALPKKNIRAKLNSTNLAERLKGEIERRTKVVGILLTTKPSSA